MHSSAVDMCVGFSAIYKLTALLMNMGSTWSRGVSGTTSTYNTGPPGH